MKIHLNLVDFNDDISPQEEIIDSIETSTRLIPFGKSGIHIKKENRGSFTSYCGGKVTDACIQKGKNSPSAAIRKKATFAANARKWKHQLGGTINSMIPLADRTDISNLFVDYDTPSNFTLKKLKEEEKKEDDLNLVDNLDYYFGVSPVVHKSKSNDSEKQVYPDDVYDGNPQSATPEQTSSTYTPTHTSTGYYISSLDFNIAKMSDQLKRRLLPHIGKESGLMGSGVYDCSDFVRKVYSDYGLKGSSRSIYNQVDHVDTPQEGDLIFVYGTQGDESKIGHVGVITNADNYANGFLEVAQGTPSKPNKKKYTGLRTYDLNNPWFTNHRVVYGRLHPKAAVAKYGMKFQFGGFIPKHISDLFVSATPKQKTGINYDALFKEDKSDKKENNNLPFLNTSQPSTKKVDNKKENNLPTFVYSEPEKQNPQQNNYSGKGYNFFKSELEQYFQHDPNARMYEDVLTRIAQHESNFNLSIQNTAGAPAYGWFQFWQDGQLNNITHYSGLNIEEFRYNPQAQISSAIKMARDIDRSWTSEDLRLAKQLGYGRNSLLRGAWLGGVGGVRQVLRGLGNPSDGHWYNGQGRTVKQAMDEEKLNN